MTHPTEWRKEKLEEFKRVWQSPFDSQYLDARLIEPIVDFWRGALEEAERRGIERAIEALEKRKWPASSVVGILKSLLSPHEH